VVGVLELLRDESLRPLLTAYLPFYDPERSDAHYSTAPGITISITPIGHWHGTITLVVDARGCGKTTTGKPNKAVSSSKIGLILTMAL